MAEIVDLTDDEARRAMPEKWGSVEADVLPAWVAEMDFAVLPEITEEVVRAVRDGQVGYPRFSYHRPLGEALAGFAQRRWGWQLEPDRVHPVSDVTAGVRVAIETLSEPGPVVLPVPAYYPLLDVMRLGGRERAEVVLDPDQQQAQLDLDGVRAHFEQGARTFLLTQPHNPWGRVFTRGELEDLRDLCVQYGVRVVSDEIHAPLALPGAEHVPYLSLEGTAEHAVSVTASSKAFNTAGLRCAQIVTGDDATSERLRAEPMPRNDSWSPLGVVAAVTAYTHGDAWLDALLQRLDANRTLLADLLATHLPRVRTRPLEGTYLAWLDARATGNDDPVSVALERGRVLLSPGQVYQPGLTGHARLNLATSPARLTEIIGRLTTAWT